MLDQLGSAYLDASTCNSMYREGGNDDVEFFLRRIFRLVDDIRALTGHTEMVVNAEAEVHAGASPPLSTLAVAQIARISGFDLRGAPTEDATFEFLTTYHAAICQVCPPGAQYASTSFVCG